MAKKKAVKRRAKAVKKAKAKKINIQGIEQKISIAQVTTDNKPGPIEVKVEKKEYGKAPEEHHFYLKDGRELKSVYELIDSFDNMPDDVFKHHVNTEKNDFANWLGDVFDEKDLAKEMKELNTARDTQLKLLKHVVSKLK
jgi:hypothetical protein